MMGGAHIFFNVVILIKVAIATKHYTRSHLTINTKMRSLFLFMENIEHGRE
ncbi:MAG: hypothetical protein WBB28_00470 [Crinalium sp.]